MAAKKNSLEHRNWLWNLLVDDIRKYDEHIAEATEDTEPDYFLAEKAMAIRCKRWLMNGVKPKQVENTYNDVLKALGAKKDILEELKNLKGNPS